MAAAQTAPPTAQTVAALAPVSLPRITIKFCTQCKWNLRAAYYAQELLQTFSTSLGEVALVPATGGTFEIRIFYAASKRLDNASTGGTAGETDGAVGAVEAVDKVLWDRKVDGGFPDTKELKGRVRDVVEPNRSLGHTDRALVKDKDKDKNKTEEGNGELERGEQNKVQRRVEGETGAPGTGGPQACKDCS